MNMLNKKPNSLELSQGESVFKTDLVLSKSISETTGQKVAIFGGSGIAPGSEYYEKAREFAKILSKAGISVITGGGPGIMEAGNRGASEAENNSAPSYGLRVDAIKEEVVENDCYIDESCVFTFDTLAVRLLTLISVSDAVVFFPGGFGTFEELFSLLVRMKVGMMKQVPVYLFGKVFWNGLFEWLQNVVLKEHAINQKNLALFQISDDIEKISNEIIKHCKQGGLNGVFENR